MHAHHRPEGSKGTKRKQQAIIFKELQNRWKTDLVARRVEDEESLKKTSAVFELVKYVLECP